MSTGWTLISESEMNTTKFIERFRAKCVIKLHNTAAYTNLYTFLLELILNQIWCVFVEQQWKSQKR